jgi:translation initiation factor 3 subunit B
MHALNVMHGVPFDSKHTFQLNRFSDVERYAEMDEKFFEPEQETYESKVRDSLIRVS